uniref:Uncharacterized protein n=1 Tax=Lepeophtheirus salmonis TaxID=72036 RepID=A0A0K2UZY0_LEPSM
MVAFEPIKELLTFARVGKQTGRTNLFNIKELFNLIKAKSPFDDTLKWELSRICIFFSSMILPYLL